MDMDRIKARFSSFDMAGASDVTLIPIRETPNEGIVLLRHGDCIDIGATSVIGIGNMWSFTPAQSRAIAAKLYELADKAEGK